MIIFSKHTSPLFLASIVFLAQGCGGADIPETGHLTGKVTLDGEPAAGVTIQACPTDGRTATGLVQEDGSYEVMYKNNVPGTKIGPNKISPVWPNGGGPFVIPKEFTNLELDVKPGENVFDIKMVSPAGAKKPKKTARPVVD